jgi:dextranase
MATAFSHGATQLLAGEAGNVLVDPYYVRNHAAEHSTLDMLARWYDLLVAAGDLLFAGTQADITRSVVGGLNGELEVASTGDSDAVAVGHEPKPGTVWRRVVQTPLGTLVHLINLTGQSETGWDTPKAPITDVVGLRLTMRRTDARAVRVDVADPDVGPEFRRGVVDVTPDQFQVDLPPLRAWQLVLIRHTDVEESR